MGILYFTTILHPENQSTTNNMADNLRDATKVGENPTFAQKVSKEEAILGDKAVGGMDNDKDHVGNVIGGLKAAINNPNTSAQAKQDAEEKLRVLEKKS